MASNLLATAANSWRNQSWGLRIMRVWLGCTWIYAGWDKATDAGFLSRGSSTFIGTQLSGYSTQSPLGAGVFDTLIEYSLQVGVIVMVGEFAIGLATLLWVAPTLAAFAGFLMSLSLWLASTFTASPYFLASNTAYAILWLSYLLLIKNKRKGFSILVEVAALALSCIALGVKNLPAPAKAAESAPMIAIRITPRRSNDIEKPFRLFLIRSK